MTEHEIHIDGLVASIFIFLIVFIPGLMMIWPSSKSTTNKMLRNNYL